MSLDWDATKAPNWDKVNPQAQESLIFGTMFLGVNPITEENYKEFYKRHVTFYHAQGWKPYLTLADVHNAVGLATNASQITPAAFKKKLMECLSEWGNAMIRKAEREVEESTNAEA
jgi:hypothetical protein